MYELAVIVLQSSRGDETAHRLVGLRPSACYYYCKTRNSDSFLVLMSELHHLVQVDGYFHATPFSGLIIRSVKYAKRKVLVDDPLLIKLLDSVVPVSSRIFNNAHSHQAQSACDLILVFCSFEAITNQVNTRCTKWLIWRFCVYEMNLSHPISFRLVIRSVKYAKKKKRSLAGSSFGSPVLSDGITPTNGCDAVADEYAADDHDCSFDRSGQE